MADVILTNVGSLTGNYDDLPLTVSTTTATTTIITGLTAVKTANKNLWIDGNLTYTILITNNADEDFVTPVFTDQLDTAKIELVENSVTVNGVTAAYTYVGGLLTINMATIATGSTATIVFTVKQV